MFKINDKVKMTRNASPASLWHKGDIGRIIAVDDSFIQYLVCVHPNCEEATNCQHYKDQWWLESNDIEAIHCLMKVE